MLSAVGQLFGYRLSRCSETQEWAIDTEEAVAAEVAAGDARLCSELGIDEVSCCRIDWLLLAADVPVAWLTAAA